MIIAATAIFLDEPDELFDELLDELPEASPVALVIVAFVVVLLLEKVVPADRVPGPSLISDTYDSKVSDHLSLFARY